MEGLVCLRPGRLTLIGSGDNRSHDAVEVPMTCASQSLPAVLDRIDAELDRSLERLFDFLRIQSISTDPAYRDQCRSAAEYVAKDLSGIGFTASIRPTGGHPIVVGKGGVANGGTPRVLF